VPALEEDVRRLDVAVDDPVVVSVLKSVGNLVRNSNRVRDREATLFLEAVAQALAADERHDVAQRAVCFTCGVHRDDVRMAELGRHLDFAHEALTAESRREFLVEDLDRNVTVRKRLASQVDPGHASAIELTEQGVPLRQRGLEPLEFLGQM